MNMSPKRYTNDMLVAIGRQSLPAMALNALLRGVLFTVFIQLLTLASGLALSTIPQMLMLALIFSMFIFSVDLIEKYASQQRLKKRP